MILRRVIQHFRQQEWTAIFLDFLIVVLGVFVGLQVSNWNQDRADSRRETLYLAALQEDFGAIIAELEDDISGYEGIASTMTLLLEQSRKDEPDMTLPELNQAARQLVFMEGTPIISATYTNLTGSGDLAIIRSQAVKDAMSFFFGRAEIIKLVSNTHEMQLVNIFQPYIIENLDYTTTFREERGLPMVTGLEPDHILEVLSTSKFRNVVAVKWDTVTDLRILLLGALKEAQAVEALLQEELQNRP